MKVERTPFYIEAKRTLNSRGLRRLRRDMRRLPRQLQRVIFNAIQRAGSLVEAAQLVKEELGKLVGAEIEPMPRIMLHKDADGRYTVEVMK